MTAVLVPCTLLALIWLSGPLFRAAAALERIAKVLERLAALAERRRGQ